MADFFLSPYRTTRSASPSDISMDVQSDDARSSLQLPQQPGYLDDTHLNSRLLPQLGCPSSEGQIPENDDIRSLGVHSGRRYFETMPLIAVSISLLCFFVSILIITPTLKLAWLLEYNGQIIVIGFLLGVMNLCTTTVVPHVLLLIEARFGISSLQNYEGLLTNRPLSPRLSLYWRLTLALLLALPLGLAVAYKRFIGGLSTIQIAPFPPLEYDIGFPRLSNSPPNDALYLLTTSMGPFLTASQYNGYVPYPASDEFPRAYGYNTLLINGSIAAILDIPTNDTIIEIQKTLKTNETLCIDAAVYAYVASVAWESDFHWNDDTWEAAVESSIYSTQQGHYGMSRISMFKGNLVLGIMPTGNNSEAYIGLYSSEAPGVFVMYTDASSPEFQFMRADAYKYNVRRAQCHGKWLLNATYITLIEGDCDLEAPANSTILQVDQMVPYSVDILPSLFHAYSPFATNDSNIVNMEWLSATHTISVVTAYWARAVYVNYETYKQRSCYPNCTSANETVLSARPVMKNNPLLYVVLAVQPTIALLALLFTAWFSWFPIGRGFGVVAILSGLDHPTTNCLQGAGLSGKLDKRVGMDIVIRKQGSEDHANVQYRIIDSMRSQHGLTARLRPGEKYG